jgi:ankyrin repeat protein
MLRRDGATAMIMASLLTRGANINAKNNNGYTALDAATAAGRSEM